MHIATRFIASYVGHMNCCGTIRYPEICLAESGGSSFKCRFFHFIEALETYILQSFQDFRK